MSDLLSVVERASESNILLAEDYLARNPVGDQGEAANNRGRALAGYWNASSDSMQPRGAPSRASSLFSDLARAITAGRIRLYRLNWRRSVATTRSATSDSPLSNRRRSCRTACGSRAAPRSRSTVASRFQRLFNRANWRK